MKIVNIFLCIFIVPVQTYTLQKLTVLTGCIGTQSSTQYLGHAGVTRSLVEGLRKVGAPFNYNPASEDQVGDVVIIVAGEGSVIQQVIELKKKGVVKKIIVGPNAYCYRYVNNPLIDLRIDPSAWVRDANLLHHTQLRVSDYLVWPAGVDEHYFNPKKANDYMSRKVLVYNKEQPDLTRQVVTLLKKYHFEPILITYGSYYKEQFKHILDTVSFAVFLSKTESQGLALAECWAMDVPTLCWNLECPHKYLEISYPVSSACPYLTEKTGRSWKTLEELELLLQNIPSVFQTCAPRAWIVENMTDVIVVRQLLASIESLA